MVRRVILVISELVARGLLALVGSEGYLGFPRMAMAVLILTICVKNQRII